MNRTTKIKITELNPHVICVLCGGYYINATTITECLHSFCRTCITRYLETSKYCPVCDVMVHKTRPLDYIRSDKTLQDLVYKLVPGLYKTEMKRRREYYAEADPAGVTVSQLPSEDRGDEFHDRIIYTEDEKISLSLELCAEGVPFKTPLRIHGHNGPDNIRIRDVRYLQCPAAFSIGNLKKFIRMKFDLKLKFEIDIFHTAEPLPDYYSLMDIAYIYTWTRRAPLRLFYTVFERKVPPKAPDPVARAQPISAHNSTGQIENTSQGTTNTPKPDDISLGRKRKLLEGPDDISPDLAFDKSKPYRAGRRKGICTPKKRAKKAVVEVDESVQEALSESEEHLAKLSLLDCSGEVRRDKTGAHGNGKRNEIADSDSIANGAMSDATDVYTEDGNTNDGMGMESVRGDKGEIGNITVATNDNVVGDIDNGAKQDKNESADNSKMSSAQVSPGSGSSITLSLFQPLNLIEPDSECKKASDKDGKQTDAKDGKLYEFDNEEMDNTAAKKPRGRPKGSKNKAPGEKTNKTKQKKVDLSNDLEKDESSNHTASKKLPRLKSPQTKKKGPVEEHVDSPTKDNTEKAKSITPADKPTGKNATDSGEVTKVKRKYVRKTKADTCVEPNQDVKRQKTDNVEQKEITQTKGKPELNGKHENSNVQTDSVKKTNAQHESNNISSVNSDTTATDKEQTVPHIQKKTNKEISEQIVQEQQVIVNSSSLQEPITPLYGETPKMNESNQGLPCSPNMDSIENGGRLVIDMGEHTDDPNGAKTNNLNDRGVKCNKTQTNGSIMASMQNGNFVSSCTFTKEIFRNSVGGEQNCGINLSKSQEIPVAHSDQYRLSMSGFSPPGLLDMMSGFSPPSITAHAHMGHMTGSTSIYQSHDQSFDQPLDLTNGNNRDEYTKGKIFKTKMLKKSFPKSDNQQKF